MRQTPRFIAIGAGIMAALGLLETVSEAQRRSSSRYPVTREDEVTRTLKIDRGNRRLEVSLISGGIRVVGHDAETVEVTARRTVRAETEADATAAMQAELAFTESGASVLVAGNASVKPNCDSRTGDWPRRPRYAISVHVEVRVPRDAALRLCAVNGGEVEVEDVSGDLEVDNVNGGIVMTGVRGAGHAVTVNGDVRASFVETPRGALLIKSVNGDLEASFPRSLSADLWMKTFNGDLWTDFEVTSLPSALNLERRNGLSRVRSNGLSGFRVGQGGPSLTFEAFNGDVRVIERP
jgi:hypothetical protein